MIDQGQVVTSGLLLFYLSTCLKLYVNLFFCYYYKWININIFV